MLEFDANLETKKAGGMMKIQESDNFKVGGPRATYVLIICSLLYAMRYADWQIMAIVLQPMKVELGLTDAQAGLVGTAFFIGIMLFTLPIAHLVDVWSRKKTLGVMAFVWSIFTVATGFTSGLTALLFARFGVGVGESVIAPGGTALISASYPEEKRAQKLGIFNMFITIGIIVGASGGGYLSAHVGGWRTPFYVFGVPGVILGILAFFMQDYRLKAADGSNVVHDSLLSNLKQLWKIHTLRWLYVGLGMFAVMQISVLNWFPALLMRAYNIKEDVAGGIMGLVAIIALVGPVLGGIFADKWQKKRPDGRVHLAAVSIAITSVFLLLELLAALDINNKHLMIFCAIMLPLYSIASGMALPAAAATAQDVVPARLRGLSWGVAMLALYLLGGAWGPLLVGEISDTFHGGYQGLALGLAVAGLFGFVASAMWFMTERHVEGDMKRAKEGSARV
jgi:MFS family permease